MEQTVEKLLVKLAEKLGTTVDHLWGVLIAQTQINAYLNIMYVAILAILGFVLFKYHKKCSKKQDGDENNSEIGSLYEEDDAYITAMVTLGCIWAFVTIISLFFTIPQIVTAFTNPEYLALCNVLKIISGN